MKNIYPKQLIRKIQRPKPDKSKRSDFYRFERNERTTLFTEEQFNDLMSTISPYDLVAYGELEPFYNKICNWLRIHRNNFLLTSGSDAGIKSIYETYISEGDEVIITLPNYAMFSVYAAMFGANEIHSFYKKDLSLNIKEVIEKISINTKLLIISNPGHTGSIVSEDQLVNIIKIAEKFGTIVLVDEAYYHFHPKTMIKYIDQFKNLIISRTFSKALGLASIRIGILISNKKIISELYKVKLVHEITGLAAKIGSYIIDNIKMVNDYVDQVNDGKKVLYSRLSINGFKVFESKANFVFFTLPKNIDPFELKQYLEKNSILVRGPFEKFPFENQLRVTVGDENQMNFFCDTIENYMKER